MGARVVKFEGGKGARKGEPDTRLPLLVEVGRIDQAADLAEAHLGAGGVPLFVVGERLALLVKGKAGAGGVGHPHARLVQVTPDMLRDLLERLVRFEGTDKRGDPRPIACPRELPGVYLSREGRWNFPRARGVSHVPLLASDGSSLYDDFDPASRLVIVAGDGWPPIPARPTREDAERALALVMELLAGFPFVGDADRSVAVAAMLSACLRGALPACPGFAFDATVRGSGKSKLMEVCGVLAAGTVPAPLTWPPNAEEQEKRVAAMLLAGASVLAIDNVEAGALKGDLLNVLLTGNALSLRVLGQSRMVRIEHAALVLSTGNNLVIAGDLTRRMLVCRLDPRTERPELRQFAFDPVERAQAQRRELVAALLTVAAWGRSVQRPEPVLGSFEAWTRRVRDPLLELGLADPCACLDTLHSDDPEREVALEVLTEWRRCFGDAPTTVAQAIRRATEVGGDSDLRDALDAAAGAGGGISAKRLGRYLLRHRDRVLGDLVLRQGRDLASNCKSWRVAGADPAAGFSGFSGFSLPTHGENGNTRVHEGGEQKPKTRETRLTDADRYRAGKDGEL